MEDLKQEYKTTAQINDLDDRQRMKYLLGQWAMKDPVIEGKLELRGDLWWLTQVTHPEGKPLEFPLADYLDKGTTLERPGVYIGPDLKAVPGKYARAKFALSHTWEREKWHNPLLIKILPETIEILTRLPADHVHQRADGSIDVDDALCRSYVEQKLPDLIEELSRQEDRIKEHGKRNEELADIAADLARQNAETATNIAARRKEAQELAHEIAAVSSERDRIRTELEAETQDRRLELERQAQERKADLDRQFDIQKTLCEQELAQLTQVLGETRARHEKEAKRIRSQTEQLRAYVRSKAERLFHLEFITQAQWDSLFPNDHSEPDDETKSWPRLDEIDDGAAGAIDHIQRYLYRRGIIYPRALLANFFALLRTGDLVILSGPSGSGKTNLVKSFARATGNVAHVIPVKPNWTSAEDLTGYYNPLQRAYVTTPFLDALRAAEADPERLHIICLDEMNLARVEYYFADFLSAMEERSEDPTIHLYSDDEAGHVHTEFRLFVETILNVVPDESFQNLGELLSHKEVVRMLQERLGVEDGESILQLHSRLRRMVAGVLNVPSRLRVAPNVRFVGAVNMDETTHYLSPKILDRSHVVQFQSPLRYWDLVGKEVDGLDLPQTGIRIPAGEFPRGDYPGFDPTANDKVADTLSGWAKEYLAPIGIEIGLRTIRQSVLYRDQLREVVVAGEVDDVAINNLLRQKVLPRFSFDGKQKPRGRPEADCAALVDAFHKKVAGSVPNLEPFSATHELADLIARARSNDGIFNYWS